MKIIVRVFICINMHKEKRATCIVKITPLPGGGCIPQMQLVGNIYIGDWKWVGTVIGPN